MLKELRVKNFHSHKDSIFKFTPGLNAVIGDTQSGKTSGVIRSLILLCKNRPLGGRFFSNFAGKSGLSSISATFFDGALISLKKKIKRVDGGDKSVKSTIFHVDGNPYSSISDEVVRKLNISDLAIQGYHDGDFLITSSSSEIAKTINSYTKLDVADKWISVARSRLKLVRSKISEKIDERKKAKKELRKYRFLDDVVENFDEVKALGISISSIENDFYDLEDYLGMFIRLREKIKKLTKIKSVFFELVVEAKKHANYDEEMELLAEFLRLTNLMERTVESKQFLLKKFEKYLKQNKVCPFCFSKINPNKVLRRLK